MQLKSLTLNGFKSFADKTTIEFNHGLTGIVGPNGSGKSNITEGIRWALGEQSAKSLRGERMGDVIFAGTSTRPALNRAEVVMTFDNSDQYLRDQPAEVSVTRRLFRDGESEFLINNHQTRLRDVINLFMDSGLGRESFAFISQGRVEAIFNSKPEQRRGIIEEAAGVLKYKQQKQQAQAQLDETGSNLDRVYDIVHELNGRMEPLAEQASIAEDYNRQTKAYVELHKQLLALEIRDLAAKQTETKTAASITKRQITELDRLIAQLEGQSDRDTKHENDIDGELTRVGDELLAKSMQLESLTGQENVSDERVQNATTTISELHEQLATARAQKTTAEATVTQLSSAGRELAAQVAKLETDRQQLSSGLLDPAAIAARLDVNHSEYIETLQQQATARNNLSSLDKEQQISASQLSAIKGRLGELDAQEHQLGERQAKSALASAEAQQAYDAAEGAHQKMATALATLTASHRQAQDAYHNHMGVYAQTETRYNTIKELSEDYTGFYAGVRTVLKNKDRIPGVIGAVAELLTVPSQYQQALEQALGGNLQAIVTADETAAQSAIALLKERRAGRATFLPVNVVRPRDLPQGVRLQLEGEQGFIGVAADLVQFDEAVGNVIRNLLGSIVIVDTLNSGVQIARLLNHRYRIVTTDGDILNVGGSMSGGSRQQGSGTSPLSRSQEVNQLQVRLQKMDVQLAAEQHQLTTLRQQLATQEDELKRAIAAVDTAAAILQNCHGDERVLSEQIDQLQQQRANLQLNTPAGSVDYAQRQTALQAEVDRLAARLVTLQAEEDELRTQQTTATAAAADLQGQKAELQTNLAVAKAEVRTNASQLEQWQQTLEHTDTTIAKLDERIDIITKAASATADEKVERKETIVALTAALKVLKKHQAELNNQKNDLRTSLSRLSAQITTAYSEHQTAMATNQTQSVELNRIKMNLETRLTTLSEEYALTYEAALATVATPEPDQPQLRSQIKLLRRGIDELGPVNPHAIAEYAEVKERFDFLDKQQADLNSAKAQLVATMDELDDEVRDRFRTVFEATAAAFTEIFPQMFGGGHAELKLTEPDDLLNTGIEIIASPPGKKLSRLSLLSGGERALTAITLLFAILRVRPVPFSILDEVEASLDEANVNRFGEFLRHYSSETQFIVITHRRGTMVAADVLYGVTMQESGVSRMVSVSIDEAVKVKEGNDK